MGYKTGFSQQIPNVIHRKCQMGFFRRTVAVSETQLKALVSLQDHVQALDGRLATVEKLLGRMADDLGDLEKRHLSLRGKVYASKLHKNSDDEELSKPSATSTRDELRKALITGGRWMPGKPTRHNI